MPVDSLTLAATFGYIDAKYTQKDAGTNLGNQFVNTPKYAASLNADYVDAAEFGRGDRCPHRLSYKSQHRPRRRKHAAADLARRPMSSAR